MRVQEGVYKVFIYSLCMLGLIIGTGNTQMRTVRKEVVPSSSFTNDFLRSPIRRVLTKGLNKPKTASKTHSRPLGSRAGGPSIGTPMTVAVTAYCLNGRMADGNWVHPGAIAVDPNVIPLGSKVYIEGLGYFTAEDTGSGIIGNHIDMWVSGYQQAINWGRRTMQILVIKGGKSP